VLLGGSGTVEAALCQNACSPNAGCDTECQYPPAWPHQDMTCGSYWYFTGTGYFHDTGQRGQARWIDAHRHNAWVIDFWTATTIIESDGCYQIRDDRCENDAQYQGTWGSTGSSQADRNHACNTWGCTGHGYACRPCEGICQ
jgi:hypothetical protein